MQDVQNIPNPDVDSIGRDDDFGSHPDTDQDYPDSDADESIEDVPSDRESGAPIEEPPAEDGMEERRRIV